jgi:uncharacterized protein YdaU (DUF1376 family)
MNPLYWMPYEIDLFERRTATLSDKEYRVLMRLICHVWATGEENILDFERAARIAQIPAHDLKTMFLVFQSTGLLEHVYKKRLEQHAKLAAKNGETVIPFSGKR